MTLKANGKRIDCGAIAHLFSQGERHADKVAFALPRYYGGWDLSGCTFALTGENAEGKQAQQVLEKAVSDSFWKKHMVFVFQLKCVKKLVIL